MPPERPGDEQRYGAEATGLTRRGACARGSRGGSGSDHAGGLGGQDVGPRGVPLAPGHVRQGLEDNFKAALADDGVKAIVLRCDGGTFIAGADISEFGKAPRGPDFNAVLNMIDLLQERGWTREQAYILCSVAVDLRISNVVDVPNYVVSALIPEAIFAG